MDINMSLQQFMSSLLNIVHLPLGISFVVQKIQFLNRSYPITPPNPVLAPLCNHLPFWHCISIYQYFIPYIVMFSINLVPIVSRPHLPFMKASLQTYKKAFLLIKTFLAFPIYRPFPGFSSLLHSKYRLHSSFYFKIDTPRVWSFLLYYFYSLFPK